MFLYACIAVLWHRVAATTTFPNQFFSSSTQDVMDDATAATDEACERTEGFEKAPPGKGREDIERIVERFTEDLDWFQTTLEVSADKEELQNKLRQEMKTVPMGLFGALCFVLFLVIFLLCCWQWWCCFKMCRCCSGPASTRRMGCFVLFLIIVVLTLLISLAIGFAGYRQLVASVDSTLCASLEMIGLTFSTTKDLTDNMSDMLGQFGTFGKDEGVGKEIQTIIDDSSEIDAASDQLVSVLDAYEGAISKFDTTLDSKFSCFACPLIANATALFRVGFSSTSAGALKMAREMVKKNIQESATSKGASLNSSAATLGDLVMKLEELKVVIDMSEDRDTAVQMLGAGIGAVFALAVLVLLIILFSSACCCRYRDEDSIRSHHKLVRRCSSCGCWLAFFLSLLVLLLTIVFEVMLFAMSGACIFLEDVDGTKLMSTMDKVAQREGDPAMNSKMAKVYDTCFGANGDGQLFDAMTEMVCPANLTNCTDAEQVERSFRDMFINDVVSQVRSAFSQVSNVSMIPLENSVVINMLVDTTLDNIRQNVSANSIFWADPRFAMVLEHQGTSPTEDNPNLNILMTDTVRLSLACSVSDPVKGKVFKDIQWFLGQLNTMTRKKFSSDVVTDSAVTVSTACTESPSTLGPVTCNLFSTFSSQDDRHLAKSLATACTGKASSVQASITDFATFQAHINLVQNLDPTGAASAAETNAIQQLFGQVSAAGVMQCDPCKAGDAVLDEIKRVWGAPADKIYNCPQWNLTSGASCDMKGGADCTRASAPWFSLVDDTCTMDNLALYLQEFSQRIQRSAQRIDAATSSFGSKIRLDLFNAVNTAFLVPLEELADIANCRPFGLKVTEMRETLCYDALVGLLKVDIAYLALGISCFLMVICGWQLWLFGVTQGRNKEREYE